MVVTLQLIATMRIFSQVYVMTNGGPAGASPSVIYYIYQTAIVQYRARLRLGRLDAAVRADPRGSPSCSGWSCGSASVAELPRIPRHAASPGVDLPLWLVGMALAVACGRRPSSGWCQHLAQAVRRR